MTRSEPLPEGPDPDQAFTRHPAPAAEPEPGADTARYPLYSTLDDCTPALANEPAPAAWPGGEPGVTRRYALYSLLDDCTPPPAAPPGDSDRPAAPGDAETAEDGQDGDGDEGDEDEDEDEDGLSVEISFDDLPIDREQIAAALEAAFADDGEITGAGRSMTGGGHIDMRIKGISDADDRDNALDRIDNVLEGLGLGESAQVSAY